jgi:hypothetical protein
MTIPDGAHVPTHKQGAPVPYTFATDGGFTNSGYNARCTSRYALGWLFGPTQIRIHKPQ